MKRILFSLLAMLVVFVLVTPVHAFMINRGTDTLGNRLIYDDDLDITWYDFSNARNTWANQVAWAGTLSVDFGGDIYDDWRLTTTVDGAVVGSSNPFFYNGTGPNGYNITNSEMGHLFYTELGNLGYYDTSGSGPQTGWGLTNTGDFQHLVSSVYWSGTEFAAFTFDAWNFDFYNGLQYSSNKVNLRYGLAVRSGDVAAAAVPEPATIALLGIGLAGMGVYGVRRRRRGEIPHRC